MENYEIEMRDPHNVLRHEISACHDQLTEIKERKKAQLIILNSLFDNHDPNTQLVLIEMIIEEIQKQIEQLSGIESNLEDVSHELYKQEHEQ